MNKKLCTVAGCTYPAGECSGACWHPEEKRMSAANPLGSVRLTVVQNGAVDLEYVAHWNGDRREVLERARRVLAMLIEEDAK